MGSSTCERVKRSEAEQVLGFARIGQGLLDVGWMGGVVHDGWFFPCLGGSVGDHVHHGMVLPCSHVERLESASLESDGEFDGADHVGYVGEIAAVAAIPQHCDGAVLLDGSLK